MNIELTRLVLLTRDADLIAAHAPQLVAALEGRSAYREAAKLGAGCVTVIERAGGSVPFQLARYTALSQTIVGEVPSARALLETALRSMGDAETEEQAQAHAELAVILFQTGELELAEKSITRAIDAFARLGNEHWETGASGTLADILQARGQLDEALAIRRERQLPVYERLGDVRSLAVTHGKIADILQARGQLDEALAIRRERELPVYERLGDVRSLAITHGKIADILQDRGQLDEALAIRRERQLPVFERLGDVRELAVTHGKIADILQARGRARRGPRHPPRAGAARLRAAGRRAVAGHHPGPDRRHPPGPRRARRGPRIRRERELPVYERLGDVRSLAITQGQIADILQARGQLDEALAIRRERQLPVYERLGDVRELVVARVKIAIILIQRGRPEEMEPAFEHLLWSYRTAREIGLHEADQIEALLRRITGDGENPDGE